MIGYMIFVTMHLFASDSASTICYCNKQYISHDGVVVESLQDAHSFLIGVNRSHEFRKDGNEFTLYDNNVKTPLTIKSRWLRCAKNNTVICGVSFNNNDECGVLQTYNFAAKECKKLYRQDNKPTFESFVYRLKLSKYHPNLLYVFMEGLKKRSELSLTEKVPAILALINLDSGVEIKRADISLLSNSTDSCIDNFHLVETSNPKQYLLYDRYLGAQKSWVFDFEDFMVKNELPYSNVSAAAASDSGTLVALDDAYKKLHICSSQNLKTPLFSFDARDVYCLKFASDRFLAISINGSACQACQMQHAPSIMIFDCVAKNVIFKKEISNVYFGPKIKKVYTIEGSKKEEMLALYCCLKNIPNFQVLRFSEQMQATNQN